MEPSEIVTGENAICPTTRPSTSATSEIVFEDYECAVEDRLVLADAKRPDNRLGTPRMPDFVAKS